MIDFDNDTIAAISTGMTTGGIGIIRISGKDAIETADKIFVNKKREHSLKFARKNSVNYGYIIDGDNYLDEVLAVVMKGPHSYTAEDTVEINCHGGILVMKRVLECIIRAGARIAQPGEFTKRAFLNGRIDLSQAEAVMDLISSENEYSLKNSIGQLKGTLRDNIKKIRESILFEMAKIESAIDDPEHYDLEGYGEELRERIVSVIDDIKKMYDTSEEGRIIKEGILTVILGEPNVGKSSLLNALGGSSRAIVTDIAGTTRDILEEKVSFSGISLRILDTAGIRKTDNEIEKIGVRMARENASEADLIFFVVDSLRISNDCDCDFLDVLSDYRNKKIIVLLNKKDLLDDPEFSELKNRISEVSGGMPVVGISAKNSEGLDELTDTVKDMFFKGDINFDDRTVITNARHRDLLNKAAESLNLVVESIDNDAPEEFFTIDLMDAYESLGNILGEELGEDLVNEIFSKFCMGK